MEARNRRLEDWFGMIRAGQVTLPRFQRFEAWRPHQIGGVIESILQVPPLPIGVLLVLEVGDDELFKSRGMRGAPRPSDKPQMNLLDGQQRMTALWRALTDDYDNFTLFFSLENENHPEIEIVNRHFKSGKRMPLWADDPADCVSRGCAPVWLLCPGSKGEEAAENWINSAYQNHSNDQNVSVAKKIISTNQKIIKIRQQLANYIIPFLSLPVGTKQSTALNVFINMNTSASPLKDFDIVVAQMEAKTRDSLHDLIDDLKGYIPNATDFGKIEDIALAVGALLNNKPPLKKTYLDPDFGKELRNVWSDVVRGIERGIHFLIEEKIFNERMLPTEIGLYLSSALWARVHVLGTDEEVRARQLIRKTIWRASFTDRYIKTGTTRAFSDYKAILDLIANPKSKEMPSLFNENPLPSQEEIVGCGWPSRKDRLARAIIAVSLYNGGHDFADGAVATENNIRNREYNHIFPKPLLHEKYSNQEINSVLNCALISWKTNHKVLATTPRQYLEYRATEANITEDDVRRRLESHLIPYDALIEGNFREFLNARAKMIEASMMTLCDGLIP